MSIDDNRVIRKTVLKAQKALAEWIVPDGRITDKMVLNTLLGILDNQEIITALALNTRKQQPGLSGEYRKFLEAITLIEEADYLDGQITAGFEDCNDRPVIVKADLQRIAEQFRIVEKERDQAVDHLESLKLRLEGVLEDF